MQEALNEASINIDKPTFFSFPNDSARCDIWIKSWTFDDIKWLFLHICPILNVQHLYHFFSYVMYQSLFLKWELKRFLQALKLRILYLPNISTESLIAKKSMLSAQIQKFEKQLAKTSAVDTADLNHGAVKK